MSNISRASCFTLLKVRPKGFYLPFVLQKSVLLQRGVFSDLILAEDVPFIAFSGGSKTLHTCPTPFLQDFNSRLHVSHFYFLELAQFPL